MQRTRAFTLIELLVVIAIIGILSAIIIVSLSGARAQARDTRRLSDIKQIQLALTLYYDACGVYPYDIYSSSNACPNNSSITGISPSFIASVPTDPSTGTNYKYTALTSGAPASCSGTSGNGATSFHLGATLETTNSNLGSDADWTAANDTSAGLTACNGSSNSEFNGLDTGVNCSGPVGSAYPNASNQETCYDVTPSP